MERQTMVMTFAVAAAAVALFKKALDPGGVKKMVVEAPTDYTAGMESLRPYLWSGEWAKLKKADHLLERFFDKCSYDLPKMRRVSFLLDQSMCLVRNLDQLKLELDVAISDVAGSDVVERLGWVATDELMEMLKVAVRRKVEDGERVPTSVGGSVWTRSSAPAS